MKTALSRMSQTTTFKAKVPNARLKKANAVLQKLGLNAGEAFNLMLAQIEIQKALPFAVSLQPRPLLSAEEQADEWTRTYGAY
jgi:addiction module RelB/DinJ family antitoxin